MATRPDVTALRETFTPDRIAGLVDDFYGRVRDDAELGPIFGAHIEAWGPHLERMTTFWGSIMRAEAGYRPGPKGTPQQIHAGLEEIRLHHFDRWLTLFDTTARDHLPAWAAEDMLRRARRMAVTLSSHLAAPNLD